MKIFYKTLSVSVAAAVIVYLVFLNQLIWNGNRHNFTDIFNKIPYNSNELRSDNSRVYEKQIDDLKEVVGDKESLSMVSTLEESDDVFFEKESIQTPSINTEFTLESEYVWGVYAGPNSGDVREFERMVGYKAEIASVFINWESNFPIDFDEGLDDGTTMLIFWEQDGYSLRDIVSGKYDEYIRLFSDYAENSSREIMIAPLYEMNGDWYSWGGSVGDNTPDLIKDTWRHIYSKFGFVPNVKFAWTPNITSKPDVLGNSVEVYYPGDEYVDVIGVDGFNFNIPGLSFEAIFDDGLKRLSKYDKDIYILSMATPESPGKAQWIDDFSKALPKYSKVKGFVWFNEEKEFDWRVNSSQESLMAFKNLISQ